MTSLDSRMPDVLKRDRAILLGALAGLAALAWAYLVNVEEVGAGHASLFEPSARPWSAWDFAAATGLWGVMMLAMMLPVASPSLLALARVARERNGRPSPVAGIGAFVAGYAMTWLAFSLLAAAAQLALQLAALLSGQWSHFASPGPASILLAVAGIYQWTPWRDACLRRCRSPLGMFLANWDDSRWGRLRMGIRHGAWCVACCWALMALSFVFGVMNLAWMAVVTAFLLLERTVPGGPWLSRGAGALLIAAAVWIFFSGASA